MADHIGFEATGNIDLNTNTLGRLHVAKEGVTPVSTDLPIGSSTVYADIDTSGTFNTMAGCVEGRVVIAKFTAGTFISHNNTGSPTANEFHFLGGDDLAIPVGEDGMLVMFIGVLISATAMWAVAGMSSQAGALTGTAAAYDPASIADHAMEAKAITVTGAQLGDIVQISSDIDLQDLQLTASVTATNVVTAVLSNSTGGAVDLGAMTLLARVFRA